MVPHYCVPAEERITTMPNKDISSTSDLEALLQELSVPNEQLGAQELVEHASLRLPKCGILWWKLQAR